MKSKNLRRICNGILAGVMAMSMMVAPAFAAGEVKTSATIDTAQAGSITIYKLFDPTGSFIEADGLKNAQAETMKPISGVEISRRKIADIKQVNDQADHTIGVYYQITDDFRDFVIAQGWTIVNASAGTSADKQLKADKTVGGVNYFKPETLETLIKALNVDQTAVENFTHGTGNTSETGGKQFTNLTNDAGMTTDTIAAADQGLYLIAETDDSTAKLVDADHNGKTGDDSVNAAAPAERANSEVNNGRPQNVNAANTKEGEMYLRTDNMNNGTANAAIDANDVTIASKFAPYLISVPMTTVIVNNGQVDASAAGQTQWLYDITSYPKNSTTEITKKIVDPDNSDQKLLRDQEDYQIGDTVSQVIYTGFSKLRNDTASGEAKKHTKYTIKDTMTNGLMLKKDGSNYVVSVKYGNKVVNPEKVDPLNALPNSMSYGVDYTVAYDRAAGTFTVDLTAAGLAKLDAVTGDSTLAVFFDSVLVSEAKIGTDPENMNQPTLTWQNTNEALHEITGNKVYDFTYELDLTKTGLDDPTKAQFEIYKSTDDTKRNVIATRAAADTYADPAKLGNIVRFRKEGEGVYHVLDNDDDTTANTVTALSPDSTGKLIVKGIDTETYVIREIQTENGKNLLKNTFDLTLTGPGSDAEGRNGNVTAKVKTDGVETDLNTENGVVDLTIDNFKGVVLHTGGAGRSMIYLGGAALAAILAVAAVADKKRRMAA